MKQLSIFFSLLSSGMIFSQVGINTANPQGTFHVDGGKDNIATGIPTAVQQSNDFIVTPAGNVGIGTTTPAVKLEINSSSASGAIKIVDGSQGAGKILTSDAQGIGTWSVAATATKASITISNSSAVTTSATQGTISYFPNLQISFPVTGYYSLGINPHLTNAGTARDQNGYVAGLYLRNTTTLATIHIGTVNIAPNWPYGNYGYRFSSFPFQYVPAGNYELGVTTLSTASFQQSTFVYTPAVGEIIGILLAK